MNLALTFAETAGSPESPQDSEEELLNYQVYGGREEASRSSDGSLSSAPSYNSFGGRSVMHPSASSTAMQ